MKWTVHPAKRDLTKTIVSAVFVVLFLVFVGVFYGIFWSIFGFIVLFVTLHSYFFPTSYEITENEVIVKNVFMTQKRNIREFRKVYVGKNGTLLSPFKHKTFLNQFRGVFLLLPDERDEILKLLRLRVEKEEEHKEEIGETGKYV
jgi:MFS superfamily sulfate permease-like transporter